MSPDPLPRTLRQKSEKLGMVHILQGGQVDAEGVGDGGQIESELHQ